MSLPVTVSGGLLPSLILRWACCSWLLYDVCICLETEINLVWGSRWTLPKCLYFLVRYTGLPLAIFGCIVSLKSQSPQFCRVYNVFNIIFLYIAAAAGDAFLMLRVLAVLKDRKALNSVVKVLYGAIYLVEFAAVIYYFTHSSEGDSPNLGCTAIVTGQTTAGLSEILLPIATGPILLLNVLLLAIMVLNILPRYRPRKDRATPLMTLFLRDGVMYFIVMTGSILLMTITPFALWSEPSMSMISLPIFLAASPVASGRLFLNLRATATKETDDSMNKPSVSSSEFSGGFAADSVKPTEA